MAGQYIRSMSCPEPPEAGCAREGYPVDEAGLSMVKSAQLRLIARPRPSLGVMCASHGWLFPLKNLSAIPASFIC